MILLSLPAAILTAGFYPDLVRSSILDGAAIIAAMGIAAQRSESLRSEPRYDRSYPDRS
jgi:hypothetical protein